MNEKLVRNRIKVLRAEKNMCQEDLAQLVEVRRETIVRLEKGTYNPTLFLAHAIARVFKKPIEEIFLFED